MRRREPCFPIREDDPPPRRFSIQRTVRFEEVDPLGIVWYGRYPSFVEDARAALSDRLGLGYMDFLRYSVFAPVKALHLDYERPLRLGETFTVGAILHWTDQARINFEYVITNSRGEVTTTGHSVQLLLDKDGNLLIVPPPFYRDLLERWKAGDLD